MSLLNLVIRLIKLVQDYGVFDIHDFEFFEVDQRPKFYLGIFTLRPKEEQ